MFNSTYRSLLRLSLIPIAIALGFGCYGYHLHAWWGDYLLGVGVFFGTLLVLLLEKEGW